jgi:hypothetical protein
MKQPNFKGKTFGPDGEWIVGSLIYREKDQYLPKTVCGISRVSDYGNVMYSDVIPETVAAVSENADGEETTIWSHISQQNVPGLQDKLDAAFFLGEFEDLPLKVSSEQIKEWREKVRQTLLAFLDEYKKRHQAPNNPVCDATDVKPE